MAKLRFNGYPEGDDRGPGLKQLFEEVEYIFPAPNSTMVVPSPVASWLMYKHPGLFEIVSQPSDDEMQPNQRVAVLGEEPSQEPSHEAADEPPERAPDLEDSTPAKRRRR